MPRGCRPAGAEIARGTSITDPIPPQSRGARRSADFTRGAP